MRPCKENNFSLQHSAEVYQAPSGHRKHYHMALSIKQSKYKILIAFFHRFSVLLSLSSGIFYSFELPDLQLAVSINQIKKYTHDFGEKT